MVAYVQSNCDNNKWQSLSSDFQVLGNVLSILSTESHIILLTTMCDMMIVSSLHVRNLELMELSDLFKVTQPKHGRAKWESLLTSSPAPHHDHETLMDHRTCWSFDRYCKNRYSCIGYFSINLRTLSFIRTTIFKSLYVYQIWICDTSAESPCGVLFPNWVICKNDLSG